ncbi:MAG: DUF4912 domain-containing protein [Candidatus Omnitrophica bacterium]|nr:DUF4912 domain-containing protein [Candidatus Omnitrophota bacterium]
MKKPTQKKSNSRRNILSKKSQKTASSIASSKKPASKKIIQRTIRKFAAPAVDKPVSFHPINQSSGTLPYSYNHTLLVLMVRDPYWIYGYWDFSSQTWDWIQDFKKREPASRVILRVHNLDKKTFSDLDVPLDAKNWYLNVGEPNASFEAELGLLDPYGRFHLIAKSNRVRTPRDTPSNVIDKNWDAGNFDEIYQLSGGGRTGKGSELFSPVRKPL